MQGQRTAAGVLCRGACAGATQGKCHNMRCLCLTVCYDTHTAMPHAAPPRSLPSGLCKGSKGVRAVMLCRLLLRNTVYLCRDVPLSHWCSYYPTTERHGLATRLCTGTQKAAALSKRAQEHAALTRRQGAAAVSPSQLCRRLLLCPMQRCHLGRELLLWHHLCRGLLLWHLSLQRAAAAASSLHKAVAVPSALLSLYRLAIMT